MYLDYFGLARAPYRITPDTDLFYAGGERGAILDALVYAIVSGEAITKVVGEVGSGKTMLCRMLECRLPDSVEIVYLANPSLAPENVLHAIAFELDLPVSDTDNRLKVMKALQDYLLTRHAENKQVVVFVEEAQGMPLATLEEIRLLSNLETKQHKLLQVVLFGQPELDAGLNAPHVRQIKERITNSLYLPPLKQSEIRDYLAFRLHLAGFRGAPIFSGLTAWLIFFFSRGLMRRINIIADKVLLAAYASGSQTVSLRHVIVASLDCEFIKRRRWLRSFSAGVAGVVLLLGLGTWSQLDSYAAVPPTAVSGSQYEIQTEASDASIEIESSDIQTIQAEPELMHTGQSSLLASRLAQTDDWLASVSPEQLTIQLLWSKSSETKSLERFLRFAKDKNILHRIHVYRSGTSGSEAINFVMGEYNSPSEARQALADLSPELKRNQPYLRNMKSVLADVGATQHGA